VFCRVGSRNRPGALGSQICVWEGSGDRSESCPVGAKKGPSGP
jgi:hypothetical protein